MIPKKSLRDLIVTTEKTVTLSDGSTVVLAIRKQTMAEQKALMKKYPNMSDPNSQGAMDAGVELAVSMVKSWEFEEEINADTFQMLPAEDVAVILNAINNKDEEEKKE